MISPYLLFNGNCNKVLEFYEKVFNSNIEETIFYGDYDSNNDNPNGVQLKFKTWIKQAKMVIYGQTFWFSDSIEYVLNGDSFGLILTVPTCAEAQKIFEELKENGKVLLLSTETSSNSFFTELIDKFGVYWVISSI